ncbi:MAG: DUF4349 domain-containing protein [Oscillospiraceae bacterium]|nr:DUF4349 domain-containing protein [Oscillospiraceae bacterium]
MRKLALFALAILLLLTVTACGGSDMPAPAVEAPAATAPPAPAAAPVFEEAADWDAVYSAAESIHWPTDDESFLPLPILTPSDDRGRQMVYTVTMHLQTDSFLPGVRTLLNEVGSLRGYLTDMEIHGHDMRVPPSLDRHASFVFRVPTETLEDFIVMVENTYNIWWLRQRTVDETERYQQTAGTLDDLREEESLLVDQLEDAEGDEQLALQTRLTEVRRLIREQERTQATITDRVIYSTVEISLFEAFLPQDVPPVDPPTFLERLGQIGSNSLSALAAFARGTLMVLVAVLPWLPILGIVALVIWLALRTPKKERLRRQEILDRARLQKEAQEDAPTEVPEEPQEKAQEEQTEES